MNNLDHILEHDLCVRFSLDSASLGDRPTVCRHLSDLRGCFNDEAAYRRALEEGDRLLYEVTAVEPAGGEGQLHYGLGILYPGRIGDEYHLTKGHLHAKRAAAEVYVGLKGEGAMLLEDEETGHSKLLPLGEGLIVYVPGHTAHRTMNTGADPLVYLGIYPSDAGHDYGAIAQRNFCKILVERDGRPVLIDRPTVAGT